MIDFIPYRPEHLPALIAQPTRLVFSPAMRTEEYAKSMAVPGRAWTGIIDGTVAGCAGFIPAWPGRAVCWAFFGNIPRSDWTRVVRRVQATLDTEHGMGSRRIEAYVLRHFGAGCRLADMLGFKIEGTMTAFAPDGADAFLYARVR